MNTRMIEWMEARTSEWMKEQMVDVWVLKQMKERRNEWTNEIVPGEDEPMSRWKNEATNDRMRE